MWSFSLYFKSFIELYRALQSHSKGVVQFFVFWEAQFLQIFREEDLYFCKAVSLQPHGIISLLICFFRQDQLFPAVGNNIKILLFLFNPFPFFTTQSTGVFFLVFTFVLMPMRILLLLHLTAVRDIFDTQLVEMRQSGSSLTLCLFSVFPDELYQLHPFQLLEAQNIYILICHFFLTFVLVAVVFLNEFSAHQFPSYPLVNAFHLFIVPERLKGIIFPGKYSTSKIVSPQWGQYETVKQTFLSMRESVTSKENSSINLMCY